MSANLTTIPQITGSVVGYKNPPKEHQFQIGNCANPGGRGKGNAKITNAYDKLLTLSEADFDAFTPTNKAERIAYNRIKEAAKSETDFALPSTKEITDRTEGKSLARSSSEISVNVETTHQIQLQAYVLMFNDRTDEQILADAQAIIEARRAGRLEEAVAAAIASDSEAFEQVRAIAEEMVLGK